MRWRLGILGTCIALIAMELRSSYGLMGQLVARGDFHAVAHKGSGSARLYRLPNGHHQLVLEGVATGELPGLLVYLSAAPDPHNNEQVLESPLTVVGSFCQETTRATYDLPASSPAAPWNSVVIWSPRYQVNFASAPLTAR